MGRALSIASRVPYGNIYEFLGPWVGRPGRKELNKGLSGQIGEPTGVDLPLWIAF